MFILHDLSLLHVHVDAAYPFWCWMSRSSCMSMSILYAQCDVACPCPCCISMFMLHVQVHAACPYPCFLSMFMLACPCQCCMFRCPCCLSTLYIHLSLLHCCILCCIWRLYEHVADSNMNSNMNTTIKMNGQIKKKRKGKMLHVHDACPCSMSILHSHSTLYMLMLQTCQCFISMSPCCIPVHDVHFSTLHPVHAACPHLKGALPLSTCRLWISITKSLIKTFNSHK